MSLRILIQVTGPRETISLPKHVMAEVLMTILDLGLLKFKAFLKNTKIKIKSNEGWGLYPYLRCFDTVQFQRSYRYFSISLKVLFFLV